MILVKPASSISELAGFCQRLMANREPNQGQNTLPIFDLWISQWRLMILEPTASASVLQFILQALAVKPSADDFWGHLQEFFAANNRAKSPHHAGEAQDLLERVAGFNELQAKKLLEHLSHCYSLKDDREFWRLAAQALEDQMLRPKEPSATHIL